MKITESELVLLQALWKEQPLTVGQIIERVQVSERWHDNTIKTLLTRILDKGAVAREKDGKRFFYRPLIERDEFVTMESESLLSKFFGGEMSPLIAHFADQKKLTKKEVTEIETILRKLKR